MARTPKEYRAQMMKERGKTEKTGINPNSPLARRQKDLASKTKTKSITPKERRAKDIASRGDNFFTRKRTPLKTGKRARDMANVEKGLPRGKPAASQMEDYKPTGTAAGKAAGKAAAAGVGTAAGKAAGKEPTTGQRVVAGLSAFQKAFAGARKSGKKEFDFKGKQFSTATKEDVQKAGASGLKEYLNKLKRKDTQIAKAPGQLKKGGLSKMKKYQKGGSVNRNYEEDLQKTSDRAAMIEKTKSTLGLPNAGDNVRKRREAKAKQETDLDLRRAEYLKEMRGKQLSPEEQQRMERLFSRRKMSKNERRQKFGFPRRPEPTAMSALDRVKEEQRQRMGMEPPQMKKGGSVMARGCKLGRKKPTKLY